MLGEGCCQKLLFFFVFGLEMGFYSRLHAFAMTRDDALSFHNENDAIPTILDLRRRRRIFEPVGKGCEGFEITENSNWGHRFLEQIKGLRTVPVIIVMKTRDS